MVSLPLLIVGSRDDPKADFDRSVWKENLQERLKSRGHP